MQSFFSLSNFPKTFHWAGDVREFHNEREPTKLNGCKFIHNSVAFYFFSSHVLTFNKASRLFSIPFSGWIYVLRKEKNLFYASKEVNKVICDYVQEKWFVTWT